MLNVKRFVFNDFQENTFVLGDDSGACIVIDPGCYTTTEQDELENYILGRGLKLEGIYNTHCHIDHVLGNQFLKDKFGAKLYIPADKREHEVLKLAEVWADSMGLKGYESATPDSYIKGQIKFGNSILEVLEVPGHAPGHLAFYHAASSFCIGGDVLFRESIGRTDLPYGDYNTLIRSIKEVMFQLPDDTVIYPGHGDSTTIRHEKLTNPFLQ